MPDRDGYDRLDSRVDSWGNRQAGNLADRPGRTIAKWFFGIVGVILALSVFFGAIGFVAGWFDTGRDIVSPANVKAQYHAVIEDWQGMEAAAANACQAKEAARNQDDPTLVEHPELAYNAQYRHIRVDYNRRQQNLFEAKHVGPKGYPRNAPTLKEMQRKVC